MRPALLNPLFRPVTSLAGIGPKTGAALSRLLDAPEGEEARVVDLLFHLPVALVDRRNQPVSRSPRKAPSLRSRCASTATRSHRAETGASPIASMPMMRAARWR